MLALVWEKRECFLPYAYGVLLKTLICPGREVVVFWGTELKERHFTSISHYFLLCLLNFEIRIRNRHREMEWNEY